MSPCARPTSEWGAARWRGCIATFVRDDRGQDLIEYALLTAALGLAGAATWPLVIEPAIGTAYRALDGNTQGLWEPPPPGAP